MIRHGRCIRCSLSFLIVLWKGPLNRGPCTCCCPRVHCFRASGMNSRTHIFPWFCFAFVPQGMVTQRPLVHKQKYIRGNGLPSRKFNVNLQELLAYLAVVVSHALPITLHPPLLVEALGERRGAVGKHGWGGLRNPTAGCGVLDALGLPVCWPHGDVKSQTCAA